MTELRILHLITGLETGGAERMLEKLVLGMDRERFENIVVSLTDLGTIGPRLAKAGIPVIAIGMRSEWGLASGLLRMIRLLRQYRPDVLQTWLYHADLIGTLAHWLTRSGATLVWNLRCSNMDLPDAAPTARLLLRGLAALSGRPAAIITNSKAGQHHHEKIGYRPRRWVWIPNGFDLTQFRPDPAARRQSREALGIGPEDHVVGMIARYDPMKDHASFIAMAEKIAAQFPAAHFVLAGRGCEHKTPLFAAASARLGSRLHLLGERRDIQQLLPSFDLCVLSSAYGEGFPNVLGEALACGVPCLATDVGDAAAILEDCGVIVPPRDPDALAQAAADILSWPCEHREEMQQRARARAERHFSLPAVAEHYEMLYREMCPASPVKG